MSECVVYWLYDDTCFCPWNHGYIGITEDPTGRLGEHRRSNRWPLNFKWQILFRATQSECRNLEHKMRPVAYMGWNKAPGGGTHLARMRASQLGRKRSPETLAKMSAAASGKSPSKETREKLSIAQVGKTKHTPESLKKLSASLKNAWTKESRRAVHKSASYKNKMSESMRRYWQDPENRAKRRTGLKKFGPASPRKVHGTITATKLLSVFSDGASHTRRMNDD